MSLEGRRANAHLLVMFSAWTSQKLIKFSLQVGFRNDLSTTIAVLISGALVRGRLITKSMYTLVTEWYVYISQKLVFTLRVSTS